MAWAWHIKCEADKAALCKSNWKDTFLTLSGTAWQGNGMSTPWERHTMREPALKGKAIPLQTWTCTEGSRRLRLPDFKTIGT